MLYYIGRMQEWVKFGSKAFEFIELDTASSKEGLELLEKLYIGMYPPHYLYNVVRATAPKQPAISRLERLRAYYLTK